LLLLFCFWLLQLPCQASFSRELIGTVELSVSNLTEIGDKVMLPLVSSSGTDVGRVCLLASVRVGPSPRTAILSSRVSFENVAPRTEISLTENMKAVRHALTIQLSSPPQGIKVLGGNAIDCFFFLKIRKRWE
jgi:hypothetical protein